MPAQTTSLFERRLRRMVLLSAAFALPIAWSALPAVLPTRRSDAIEAEVRQNTNLARALEEHTLRVLATADQALNWR